jgi:large subunit ribosomal protein L23
MANTKKVATEATQTKAVEKTPVFADAKAAKKVAPAKVVEAKPVAAEAKSAKTNAPAKAKKETKTEKVAVVKTEKATSTAPGSSKVALSSYAAIIRPLITEKSMKAMEKQQKITVEVDRNANKTQIKLAFEATYKVKVKKVNVVNVHSKFTRRGQYPGTISAFKKAIVTLVSGQALDLFKE